MKLHWYFSVKGAGTFFMVAFSILLIRSSIGWASSMSSSTRNLEMRLRFGQERTHRIDRCETSVNIQIKTLRKQIDLSFGMLKSRYRYHSGMRSIPVVSDVRALLIKRIMQFSNVC